MTSKMPYKKNERVGEEMHKLITKLTQGNTTYNLNELNLIEE